MVQMRPCSLQDVYLNILYVGSKVVSRMTISKKRVFYIWQSLSELLTFHHLLRAQIFKFWQHQEKHGHALTRMLLICTSCSYAHMDDINYAKKTNSSLLDSIKNATQFSTEQVLSLQLLLYKYSIVRNVFVQGTHYYTTSVYNYLTLVNQFNFELANVK